MSERPVASRRSMFHRDGAVPRPAYLVGLARGAYDKAGFPAEHSALARAIQALEANRLEHVEASPWALVAIRYNLDDFGPPSSARETAMPTPTSAFAFDDNASVEDNLTRFGARLAQSDAALGPALRQHFASLLADTHDEDFI